MLTNLTTQHIELWPIERLVEYPRNPRKNDDAVDRMCASIQIRFCRRSVTASIGKGIIRFSSESRLIQDPGANPG